MGVDSRSGSDFGLDIVANKYVPLEGTEDQVLQSLRARVPSLRYVALAEHDGPFSWWRLCERDAHEKMQRDEAWKAEAEYAGC